MTDTRPPSSPRQPTTTAEIFADRPGWSGSEDDVFGAPGDGDGAVNPLRSLIEWLAVIIGALLAALLIKTFLFQAFYIPSESMVPTLEVGDRVLVNKLSYEFGEPDRGDVVVFHKPDSLPESDIDEFIKRVVAVPGDVIEGRDGVVFVNDVQLDETYLPPGTFTHNLPRQTVPAGHLFVMGDNRSNSQDSRVFGPIAVESVVGQAFVRVWPLDHLGGL